MSAGAYAQKGCRTPMQEETLLTVAEVAEIMRVKDQTVRRWVRDGRIEVVKIGGTIRILSGQLSRFVPGGDR